MNKLNVNCFTAFFVSQGKPSFLSTALASLPGHSGDDVMEHVQWYDEYLTLKESRKEAIHKWRDVKEVRPGL